MDKIILEPLKLLVIGKTGVGKSAFCNFFFGEDIFESNVGKPVTKNINSHKFNLKDIPVEVYDTEGFEVTNIQKIRDDIFNLINHNNIYDTFYLRNYYSNITKNIHGIFYLINASSARIESFEIDLIKKFSEEYQLPVSVILTHSDVATSSQVLDITTQLEKNKKINIISMCSIQKTLRGGRKSVTDELLKEHHTKLTTLFLETSGRYYLYSNLFSKSSDIKKMIFKVKDKILAEVKNANLSIFNLMEWEKEIEKMSEKIEGDVELISVDFENIINELENVSTVFSPHIKSNMFDDILNEFTLDIEEEFDIDKLDSVKKIENNFNTFDEDSGLFSKIGAGLSLAFDVVTAESTLKDIVNEAFDLIENIFDKKVSMLRNKFKKESWVYQIEKK